MPAFDPSPGAVRHGLRLAILDGALFSGMLACVDTWLVPMLKLDLHAPVAAIGMIAIAPQVALILLGTMIRPLVRALDGNKRTAVVVALVQASALIALSLPLHATQARWSLPLAAILVVAVNVLTGIASPAWFAWMGELVPRPAHGRFTSRRSTVVNITRLAAVAVFAGVIQLLPMPASPWGMQAVLAVAAGCRLVSAWLQHRTPERSRRPAPAPGQSQPAAGGFLDFLRSLHRTPFGRWTLVWSSLFCGTLVSAPFVVPYLLASRSDGGLALSSLWYALVLNLGMVIKIITYPAAGRLVRIHGAAAMMRVATTLLVIVPLGWAFTTSVWVILGFEVLGGIAWALLEVAIGVLMLSCHPEPLARSRMIGYHQTVFSLFALAGGLLGTVLIAWDGLPTFDGNRFRSLLLVSVALRLPAVAMAARFLPPLKAATDPGGRMWQLIPGSRLMLAAGRGVAGALRWRRQAG